MSSYTCKNEHCSRPTFHHEGWDTYFCVICNTWNEGECGDLSCYYCTGRPAKPLDSNAHSVFLECLEDDGFEIVVELVEFYLELEERQ